MLSESVLKSHCRKVKNKSSGGFDCLCNCHDDHEPSFHWEIGRDGWVGNCFVCRANGSDFAKAAGINVSDLFLREPQKRAWMSKTQYGLEKNCLAKYVYRQMDSGEETHIKYRLKPFPNGKKNMKQGYDKDGEWVWNLKEVDTSLSIFCNGSIKKLKDDARRGNVILYTEGEADALTGAKYGYPTFTCGSKNDWESRREVFKYIKDGMLVIFADNDVEGIKSANGIHEHFEQIGGKAVVIIPPGVPDKGDISDYMESHTKADLQKLIDDAIANGSIAKKNMPCSEECNVSAPQARLDRSLEQALKDLHAEQYETTDKGFGRLFADIFKDKHRYNPSRRDFMHYDGRRWIDDVEGLNARASAKALSDALIRYAVNVDTDGKYLKSVASLCNIRNRNNMIQDSKDVYFFDNEKLDTDDFTLNVENGTLDLSGSNPVFMPHNPEALLSKLCNAEYDPAATCEEWEKFLGEVMQGDKEKIAYLQKIAGISLTGITKEETCFILYGSTTRNGKGTFCETLVHLLGDYAITIKPESLAVRQNLDSRTASGDIARLAGCRFCNASEPQKRMLFDTALLKTLLGRDSITARHLYQREFSFIPKFKLVINTNYLPTVTDDTVFSSGRINVVSFDRHFPEHEQDKDLKNRLKEKGELSGILNWCLEGLRLYRKEGLNPPATVRATTDAYRADSDKIGNFINECLAKTGFNSKAGDIYETYARWCADNGYGTENKGNFFAELKAKGLFANSGTVNGMTVRNIVKGYTLESDFVKCEGQEEFPFD